MFDYIMQAGDRVVYNCDKERRHWGGAARIDGKGLEDGALGTIIGRNRYQRHYGRFGIDCYSVPKPGIYAQDGPAIVKWDGFNETSLESYDIEMVDQEAYKDRYQRLWVNDKRDINVKGPELNTRVFVGNLPDTKCWEQDIVETTRDNLVGRVEHINFHLDLDSRGYCYDIAIKSPDGTFSSGTTFVHDSEIKTVIRGNVWNLYHKKRLVFADLRDEIAFWMGMYKYEEVRNPDCNLYVWTLNEIKAAVKNGLGDFARVSNMPAFIPVDYSDRFGLIRMNNRRLGEKARAEFLRGFRLKAA